MNASKIFASVCRSVLLVGCLGVTAAQAQVVTGSDGSDGAFVFVQDTGPGALANTMTIDLGLAASGLDGMGQPITWQTSSPVIGRGVYDPFAWGVVFKYTTVDVPAGKTVRFWGRAANPPVVWLAQGDVTIRGVIDLSGQKVSGASVEWLAPGPGAFHGGTPGNSGQYPTGARCGYGPGGGGSISRQHGAFAVSPSASYGSAYGSAGNFPLIGGSGGSGPECLQSSGGGGGGAILIACNQRLAVLGSARIFANGGWHANFGNDGCEFHGSGGAIRLVAATFVKDATSLINAKAGPALVHPNDGRIRIEASTFEGSLVNVNPTPSLDLPGILMPNVSTPVVRVTSIRVGAGTTISVPVDPRADFLPTSADVVLDSIGNATLFLEARNIQPGRTGFVRVGAFNGQLQTASSTPFVGTYALSTATATVTLSPGMHAMQVRVVL